MSEPTTRSWDANAYRGNRWKSSAHGLCPHCGQPLSHGLRGDPTKRRVPPCLRPKTAGQLAAGLPRRKTRAAFAPSERFPHSHPP